MSAALVRSPLLALLIPMLFHFLPSVSVEMESVEDQSIKMVAPWASPTEIAFARLMAVTNDSMRFMGFSDILLGVTKV
jgi:hypothetical protein